MFKSQGKTQQKSCKCKWIQLVRLCFWPCGNYYTHNIISLWAKTCHICEESWLVDVTTLISPFMPVSLLIQTNVCLSQPGVIDRRLIKTSIYRWLWQSLFLSHHPTCPRLFCSSVALMWEGWKLSCAPRHQRISTGPYETSLSHLLVFVTSWEDRHGRKKQRGKRGDE